MSDVFNMARPFVQLIAEATDFLCLFGNTVVHVTLVGYDDNRSDSDVSLSDTFCFSPQHVRYSSNQLIFTLSVCLFIVEHKTQKTPEGVPSCSRIPNIPPSYTYLPTNWR